MTDTLLKTFILYCQSVETAYMEWKNYWINYYMNNESQDLYNVDALIPTWLKNLTSDKSTSNY
jgi:hypothetical protein